VGVLSEAGTGHLSRAPEFTPVIFGGVCVALLVSFLSCLIMYLYVLSSASASVAELCP
jgi:hypothetical protein